MEENKTAEKTENQNEEKDFNKIKLDFERAHYAGIKKGQTEALGKILSEFEVSSIDELKERLQPPAKKKEESNANEEFLRRIEAITSEKKKLEEENQRLKNETQIRALRESIGQTIANYDPYNAASQKLITDLITTNYDIKDGRVYAKGSDIPHFIGNEPATIDLLIKDMKAGDYANFFKTSGTIQHKQGHPPIAGSYKLKRQDMLNGDLVAAIKESGQWDKVVMGQDLDLSLMPEKFKNLK